MKHVSRRSFLVATGAASLVASPVARAQAFPAKPIRLIVPFPAGTSPDVSGRLIARRLAEQLQQSVLVDNRPGNTGHIGTDLVVKSRSDGYTLGLGASSTHAVSPHVLKGLPYDPIADITPIGLVARIPNVLVVHPSLPVRTVPELIAYAKSNPGKLTFASLGNGSNLHLAGEWFKVKTGVDMVHVPYNAQNLAVDFQAGRIQLMFDNAINAVPFVKSGRLNALAVASEDAVADLPGLPPMSRFIPGFSLSAWVVLFGPKGMPSDVVSRLEAELRVALRTDEVRESFSKQVLLPGDLDAGQTKAFLQTEHDKWARIIRETGVKIES